MKTDNIKIVEYDSAYAEETVRMWRQSKETALGQKEMHSFEVNKKAQRFYERNGFKIIGRGYENEENLDDVKYEWINDVQQGAVGKAD